MFNNCSKLQCLVYFTPQIWSSDICPSLHMIIFLALGNHPTLMVVCGISQSCDHNLLSLFFFARNQCLLPNNHGLCLTTFALWPWLSFNDHLKKKGCAIGSITDLTINMTYNSNSRLNHSHKSRTNCIIDATFE